MRVPPVDIPADIAGGELLAELGGAYEYETGFSRRWLIRVAGALKTALEESTFSQRRGVPDLVAALTSLIDFLQSIPDEAVTLYSYDPTPSINELLAAFREGSGSDDWAMEELAKRGNKGRRALLSVLKKEENKDRLLAAISLLLIVFQDEQTFAAIERFIGACDDEIGRQAALLVAAYRPSQSDN